MPKKKIVEFIIGICKERGLSLRSLSINAGLSPGAVHSLIRREYEPSLYSLNRIADYLGVKRQYLWQLAGFIEEIDYDTETELGDPRLRLHLAKIEGLPDPDREMIINIVATLIAYIEMKQT